MATGPSPARSRTLRASTAPLLRRASPLRHPNRPTRRPVVHEVTVTHTRYGHKTTVTTKEPLVWDLHPHSLGDGQMMATGDITLPEDPGSGQYRLVITEGEPFYTDNFSPQYPYARRIVYADAIVLE